MRERRAFRFGPCAETRHVAGAATAARIVIGTVVVLIMMAMGIAILT